MNQDSEHLKILSIFHYVVAGIAALFACIPFFHFFMGLAMVAGWFPDSDGDRVMGMLGLFFMVFAGLFILAGWTFAAALFIAGRKLAGRRSYTFCLVMAGIACVFMPFGTVLGVFTILVLMRPSVKELFGVEDSPPALDEQGA